MKSIRDIEENKALAALSYIWILFLVPLLLKRDSTFAQYHAKQGLILFLVWTIIGFIFWLPIIGWLLGLGVIILFVIGMINALTGKMQPLPIIGKYAERMNI
ncbi:MAG: hypothetical protein WC107_02285 [Patescibacteria group bacterium]